MIQLKISIPGQPSRVETIEKGEVVIGRESECDVVIPGGYVSKRHVRILSGVVVVDMKSTNGVYIEGERVAAEAAVVLEGPLLQLGPNPEQSPRVEILATGADRRLAELEDENTALKERIAQLESRGGTGAPEQDFDQTLVAPLGVDFVPDETIVDAGRAPVFESAPEAKPAPGPQPASGPADTVVPASASSAPPTADGPGEPASEPGERKPLSFEEFFGGGGEGDEAAQAPATPPAPSEVTPPAVHRPKAPPVPAVPTRGPTPFVPDADSGGSRRIVELYERFVQGDVADAKPALDAPVDEFVTLESLRLLRKVEQAITRIARDLAQLYDIDVTYMPGAQGARDADAGASPVNFRSLSGDVLADPTDRIARQRLVDYFENLREWLGVSLSANRKAAREFVRDLRRELSVDALTAGKPIPVRMKVLGKEGNVLWERVQDYLRELSDDTAEDKLEKHARRIANDLLEGREPS